MGKIVKGINIFLSIILLIIAAGVAFIAIPYFGNQALIVRSGSMEPTIDVGSITVVRQNQALISPLGNTIPAYKKGDIIAFRSENNLNTIITHRVFSIDIKKEGIFYKTKGDANNAPDGWIVNEKNILGRSFFIIPSVGKLLTFAKSKLGILSLIVFPAALVIVLEFISIISHVRKNRKKQEVSWEDLSLSRPNRSGFRFTGLKIVVAVVLFASFAIPVTFAFYGDTETSTANVLQAASSFETTVTPTPIPGKSSNLFVSDDYTCSGGASNTSVSEGIVTIIKDSTLDIMVTLSGALPNTDYQLWVNQDPGACPLPSPTVSVFIHTDASGNGTNTLINHPLTLGATNFWVSLVGGSDVLRSSAVNF